MKDLNNEFSGILKNQKVHLKNTREVGCCIIGMTLQRAENFLKNIMIKKEIVPFRKYRYGIGSKSQSKQYKAVNGRWPKKSAKIILSLIKNLISIVSKNNMNQDVFLIKNININQAIKGRRRTFRAHGRINPFENNPCHIKISIIKNKINIPKY
mmetsp:Transcript_21542/g.48806  ORF Transcript_21542/g.48806 Transcript_21542/m.48806 type:complete len:154 (+) Transcript_21542:728-1189(+)